MDTKLKNNKGEIILFFIIVFSIALMLLVFEKDNSRGQFDKPFYENNSFQHYISEKAGTMYDEIDNNYEDKDHNENLGRLNNEKNIRFMAVNNKTNKIYTNTQYNSISDFKEKEKEKGYVEIEGENYEFGVRINNEKFIKGSPSSFEMNEDTNISVYAIIPEKLEETDELKGLYGDYNSANNETKYVLAIGMLGLVVFIAGIFISKKREYKFINTETERYKKYYKVPVELKLIFIGCLMIIDSRISIYDYSIVSAMKIDPTLLVRCVLLKVIYITIIYLLIQNIKDRNILKNSIIGKVFVASRKIRLIRRMLLILLVIIVINIAIDITVGVVTHNDGIMANCMVILGFTSLIGFIAYILLKLSYLNEIMEGVNKIKDGDLNYKIEVKGNDEFTVLAENINDMGSGLENSIEERLKSERMKSELITNVSHDLKTPLTSILNYVDLLTKEDVMPQHLNDYIEILDQKSKRLKVLIEDLFEAAKATSGTVELNIEKIQLNQLLTQSIAEMEGKVTEANLDMKVNFPENKIYINADGKKLFRVFENLISNIVKYSLKGTRVYIDLYTNEEYAYVTFKNISAYELSFEVGEITERFKRGDDSRSEEGSGLGLSIAKGLVEIQGGEFVIQTDGDLFKAIVKLGLSKD
ncbi:HAMP domain-containing sensor histidine kinase [Clostridium gasigenes]|uniref:HAMP domain-containing sensor histidine kinase n=1 Tax=Clostridium gasigenes TaxID=94869 RepID=UPI001C0E616A|nr:HAMP domain-containing sensor histidine kinase [Clostridium gasigenes]MBU3109530.1 HAMP domain-containing histidine kinase [Clostridium gasigenes]